MAAWPIPRFEAGVTVFEEWIEIVDSFIRSDPDMTIGRAVSILKAYGGSYLIRLLKTLPDVGVHVSAQRLNAYQLAVKKLKDHFEEETNVFIERGKFREMRQLAREQTKEFVFRLREQAERCGFSNTEEQVYEQLVQGMADGKAKRAALLKPSTVAAIVKEANLNESIQVKQDSEINWLNNEYQKRRQNVKTCHFCKQKGHFIRECAELKKEVCSICKRKGHTASRCWSAGKPRSGKSHEKNVQSVRFLEETVDREQLTKNEQPEEEYLFFMEGEDEVKCVIGGVAQIMLVDSGAKSNIIPQNIWAVMKAKGVKVRNMTTRSDKTFKAFGGAILKAVGSFNATIEAVGEQTDAKFYVLEAGEKALLGSETAKVMKILNIKLDVSP